MQKGTVSRPKCFHRLIQSLGKETIILLQAQESFTRKEQMLQGRIVHYITIILS